MPADFPYPVHRLAFERTIRLVASARLRDPVLLKLVDRQSLDELAEIEGATSGRLTVQEIGGPRIDPREFVVGVPHAHHINAAFAYWRPAEMNRFNGPGRGAWYAALEIETSLAEVAYHLGRELERVGDLTARVEYSEMFASFAGEFVDLRAVKPSPPCLDPTPSIGYPAGNALAASMIGSERNGIIYPSVRRDGGTCIVALRPQAVQSVAQGDIWMLQWTGSTTPSYERVATPPR